VDDRKRTLVFASILVISLIVVGYLVFFTPSESKIDVPTPTVAPTELTPATPVAGQY
jgi:hypothetical protein